MHKTLFTTCTSVLVGIALAWQVMPAFGVDFESFDFNDASFTELDSTVNTANPGNSWSTDINVLTDSFTDGAGDYEIKKFNDAFAPNYLQIDDITSSTVGSRFIAVDMSGWEFFDSVPGEGEEIRFAFLNDDTGTSGSAVAAEVRVDRNTDTEAIELRGLAVGVGSSDISDRATLNTAQANPFTMVLELNKTSNTYEVFYKDGSNPSQSLGMGSVVPARDGNSIRFVVNNNFGSDINEFLSIDRVALTDTNPLTDLLDIGSPSHNGCDETDQHIRRRAGWAGILFDHVWIRCAQLSELETHHGQLRQHFRSGKWFGRHERRLGH